MTEDLLNGRDTNCADGGAEEHSQWGGIPGEDGYLMVAASEECE